MDHNDPEAMFGLTLIKYRMTLLKRKTTEHQNNNLLLMKGHIMYPASIILTNVLRFSKF